MAGRTYQLSWLAKADPSRSPARGLHRRVRELEAGASDHRCAVGCRSGWDSLANYRRDRANVDGVLGVDRVRIRRGGSKYFADVSVAMSRTVTFQKSEQVANEVAPTVRELLPDADVVVNATSRASGREPVRPNSRRGHQNNLNVHDISVQDMNGAIACRAARRARRTFVAESGSRARDSPGARDASGRP